MTSRGNGRQESCFYSNSFTGQTTMTDNTNIEALPELPGPGLTHAGECAERGHWFSADQMREYGLLCRRAALSNAEPVGYGTLLGGGKLHAMRNTKEEADRRTETWNTRLPRRSEAVTVPLFLHPGVPTPLAEEIALLIAKQASNGCISDAPIGIDTIEDAINAGLLKIVRAIEQAHGIGLPLTNTGEQG